MEAYRGQEPREVCSICDETALATSRCARCGAPLCDQHGHDKRRRCARCERQFAAEYPRRRRRREPIDLERINRVMQLAFFAFLALSIGGTAYAVYMLENGWLARAWIGLAVVTLGLLALVGAVVWRSVRAAPDVETRRDRRRWRELRAAFLDERPAPEP